MVEYVCMYMSVLNWLNNLFVSIHLNILNKEKWNNDRLN
jgi:hypothetical protein